VLFPRIVNVPGGKLSIWVTVTSSVSPLKPGAEALIFAVPTAKPFTMGCVAGASACAGMNTLLGVIVAFGLSLERVIVTPPAGAPVAKVTGYGADWPGATEVLTGSRILPNVTTLAVVLPPT
jgi:hypothetical protein